MSDTRPLQRLPKAASLMPLLWRLALVVLVGAGYALSTERLLYAATLLASSLWAVGSIVVHELGHVGAARLFGARLSELGFGIAGAGWEVSWTGNGRQWEQRWPPRCVRVEFLPRLDSRHLANLVVAAAGPAVNLLMAGLLWAPGMAGWAALLDLDPGWVGASAATVQAHGEVVAGAVNGEDLISLSLLLAAPVGLAVSAAAGLANLCP